MVRDWDKDKSPTARAYANVRQANTDEAKLTKQVQLEDEIHTVELVISELQIKLAKERAFAVDYDVMDSRNALISSLFYAEGEAQIHLIELKRKLKALG